MASNYEQLVEALRCCAGANTKPTKCPDYDDSWCSEECLDKHLIIAADAIEALQAEQKKTVTQIFGEEQQEWEEYCTGLMNQIRELKAQLPKRGEWEPVPDPEGRPYKYVCSNCHRFHVNEDEWYGYCPNCGAVMGVPIMDGPIITPCRGCSDYDGYGGCKSKGGCARAKMEVQDDKA